MELKTKYHGTIEYSEGEVIHFKKGMPGFQNLKKFIMFPVEENNLFSVLHSIENNSIGFIVTSPFNVEKDYEIELSDAVLEDLNIKEEKDVLIFNTVTLSSDVKKITSNLKAPIVINIKDRLGEQIILNDEKYEIKYPLFKE
ncbi:flagellar assembly factor FliW [Clostridium pasteurianum DSM 525 = ATCC 6013]|uniref:Flagellar assembly factor FliW n=1 Tax=Clostridium pasteurianum DSM 525 = ATCC 6013 TaxID=1262449 RepID=A0A0H3J1R3_CLOPA|nr:flagellar assembly protein FliW [Clostridium pasteurianum]AJA47841.1 flagellar assembly factor FliW [Clostridium pasteurianum DSM 525 = ATCC 6013]AJA51829.1 flagellar assembly factor FliW [Clostridium pasteurianum DSM 525 = ATCC 6013]AOZ75132.1 flagellar biosynthesis protein FliW [Clostridium pasteurianum DSM 525 = ATCC 6013]AOZ78927.1 flagellar biosynthesis protein FliW [Clostridium pasteurianum]ELP59742.1 flagellar assembly protein FliW [Clostridium pasteurianum DSM 525 = ATCC 6013]